MYDARRRQLPSVYKRTNPVMIKRSQKDLKNNSEKQGSIKLYEEVIWVSFVSYRTNKTQHSPRVAQTMKPMIRCNTREVMLVEFFKLYKETDFIFYAFLAAMFNFSIRRDQPFKEIQ
jgi:hypothetical protein